MTSRGRKLCWGGLGLTFACDLIAYALLVGDSDLGVARALEGIAALCWVLGVALLAALSPSRRLTAVVVLGAGLVLGLTALTRAPSTSTDEYRYIWDGKVQLAGVDPYRYAPAAPQLARLRDPSLFGAPDHCTYHFHGGCTSINRPTVHTIYPPVAEGAFTLVRLVSFGGRGDRLPLQVAALLGSLAIGWLLLRWGGARGRPWLAAVWMWCPTVLTDLVNNAHVDWLAVLFVVLAYATPAVRRPGWTGALIGASVATKLYPVLALPSMLSSFRRGDGFRSLLSKRNLVVVGSALAVVVLVYIPHVAAVGSAVIGYLPGYLNEEHYSSGTRLLLIGWVLPHPLDTVVGAVLVVAAAAWAWLRCDPLEPQRSAVVVLGVTLFAFTPNYGWYMSLLVALVAMTCAWEWVPLCVAGTFAYLSTGPNARYWYLTAFVLVVVLVAVRVRLRPRWWSAPSPVTSSSVSSSSVA